MNIPCESTIREIIPLCWWNAMWPLSCGWTQSHAYSYINSIHFWLASQFWLVIAVRVRPRLKFPILLWVIRSYITKTHSDDLIAYSIGVWYLSVSGIHYRFHIWCWLPITLFVANGTANFSTNFNCLCALSPILCNWTQGECFEVTIRSWVGRCVFLLHYFRKIDLEF